MPTDVLLSEFASIPTNLVIIGPRRLTIAYAKNNGKVVGSTGKTVPLMKLIDHIFDFIAKHSTVGAEVTVFHHSDGFIGTVKKAEGLYMPVETISK